MRKPQGECDCGRPLNGRRSSEGCRACLDLDNARKHSESTTGRILQALRFLDRPQLGDLAVAMDEDPIVVSARVQYLVDAGEIEREWVQGFGAVYRLKQRRAA